MNQRSWRDRPRNLVRLVEEVVSAAGICEGGEGQRDALETGHSLFPIVFGAAFQVAGGFLKRLAQGAFHTSQEERMDPLQRLVELEELKHLKASYFYYLDTKDWDSWLKLFAPDATLQWDNAPSIGGRDGQTSQQYTGIDQIREHVAYGILHPAQTVHQGHTPILELTSEDTARGIWPMEDIVSSSGRVLHAFGHYRETYRKIDGEWKIASLYLTRLRVTVTHV